MKRERTGASSLGLRDQTPDLCSISVEWDLSCPSVCLFQNNGNIVGKRQKARGGIRQRENSPSQWTSSLESINPFPASQAQKERVFLSCREEVFPESTTHQEQSRTWSHPFNYLADSKLKPFKIIIINKSNSLCPAQYLSSKINDFSIIKEK